jgi:hypothetical protein
MISSRHYADPPTTGKAWWRFSWCSVSDQVEYRDVVGFPGYRVGNDGSVWSCWKNNGRCSRTIESHWGRLGVSTNDSGHMSLGLYRNGIRSRRWVHRLVLEAFVGLCPRGMQCRHLDGNPKNNKLDNLKWGTPTENSDDSKSHGTRACGSGHGRSKMNESNIQEILEMRRQGLRQWQIAESFGISQSTVSSILLKKTWKHLETNS